MMKFRKAKRSRPLSIGILFLTFLPAQAAVIVPSDLSIRVETSAVSNATGPNGSPDTDLSDLVDRKEFINNQRNPVGEGISLANPLDLTIDTPDPGDFSVTSTGTNSAILDRTVNSGPGITASAFVEFTVSFEINSGESGVLSLDFDYAVTSLGIPSNLVWSLSGPDSNVSEFSGSFSSASSTNDQNGTTAQTASLTTPGTYNFSITASVPEFAITSRNQGEASFSNFSLNFDSVAVPEPSSLSLLILAFFVVGRRRR